MATELLREGVLNLVHKQMREGLEQEWHMGLPDEVFVTIFGAGFRV